MWTIKRCNAPGHRDCYGQIKQLNLKKVALKLPSSHLPSIIDANKREILKALNATIDHLPIYSTVVKESLIMLIDNAFSGVIASCHGNTCKRDHVVRLCRISHVICDVSIVQLSQFPWWQTLIVMVISGQIPFTIILLPYLLLIYEGVHRQNNKWT